MLNSNMNYPYPILRTQSIDYETGVFNASITKTNEHDGYTLDVTYSVNNKFIKELLDKHMIAYALQIQCISTWYREIKISDEEKQKVFLPSSDIHERVDICPCIVALEEIHDFYNDDFAEDFEGISFCLHKGEIVGIGERYKFDAIYKNDIIKKGDSIVHFIKDINSSVMYCEWDFETIQIHLPEKQCEKYGRIGENEPWKVPLLNAIYVVPVIVQAISEIAQDELYNGESNLSQRAWYKTLRFLIEKAAKGEVAEFKKLLNDPIKTAQLLLNDNSAQSLNLLDKVAKQL